MDETFIDFCKTGNLNYIINHININKINIHAYNELGFKSACNNRQVKIKMLSIFYFNLLNDNTNMP